MLIMLLLSSLLAAYRLGWQIPVITDALESLELKTLDWRFRMRGYTNPGDEVVILAFDDLAMNREPELFEKRDGWVKVLESLKKYKVKTIGIDALFVDPERILDASLQSELESFFTGQALPITWPACTKPIELLTKIYHETQGDERLESIIEDLKNVILACHVGSNGSTDPGLDLSKASYGQSSPGGFEPPVAKRAVSSIPRFNRAAQALGVITVSEDSSHSVRQMVAVRRFGQSYLAPLAIQVIAAFEDVPRESLVYMGEGKGGHPEIRIGKLSLTLDLHNSFGLNYRGGPGTFPTYSVKNLVDGKIPLEALRGKIALIGFTYFGHDRSRTPFSGNMPGVEVHATAIDNILANDPIRRTPWWSDTLLCMLLGTIFSFLYWQRFKIHPVFKAGGSLLILGAYLALGLVLFDYQELWINWSGPIIVFVLLNIVCLTLSYVSEELARKRIRVAFSHYLSNDVIDQLISRPDSLKLGGERRTLTVLFSDIRGFTSMSEAMDPESLTDLLNEYFTPMTRIVFRHRGLLDKFIGDALMAIFGAPVDFAEHPHEACAAALEMTEELRRLNRYWQKINIPALDIGIGINTGPMSVGNMGSVNRFDYTVIGDNVNLASRLEGLNKVFGTRIIISQSTRTAVGDAFTCRELDLVAVKGKTEPVLLFELMHQGMPGEDDSWIKVFESALSAYRQGDFTGALVKFQDIWTKRQDRPSKVFMGRCEEMMQSKTERWDGVYRAEKK